MSQEIIFGHAARKALSAGIQQLCDVVKVTLGPTSKSVVLSRKYGAPLIIDDGVTIAREVSLSDPLLDVGARLVKEVSARTNDEAGDGTTTSTILAAAILREAMPAVAAGNSPVEIKRGIEAAMVRIIEELEISAMPVNDHETRANVATIACGDPQLGAMVAAAIEAVGDSGVVLVEESQLAETTMELIEGTQYDRGWLSVHFVNDKAKMQAVLYNPKILIYDGRIQSYERLMPILDWCSNSGHPLIILADDVDRDVMKVLVVNNLKGSIKCCAIRSPGYGVRKSEILEDIATLTGGRVVSSEAGDTLEKFREDNFGSAEKIIVAKKQTTIMRGRGSVEAVSQRSAALRTQLEEAEGYDQEKISERISKLAGKISIIKAGGHTEVEVRKLKAKIEDAVHATRGAIEEGIVAGGGAALIHSSKSLQGTKAFGAWGLGFCALIRAVRAPLSQLAINCGVDPAPIVEEILESKSDRVFDATQKSVCSMNFHNVIDPVKVVKMALRNAVSLAGTVLTAEAIVVERGEPNAN